MLIKTPRIPTWWVLLPAIVGMTTSKVATLSSGDSGDDILMPYLTVSFRNTTANFCDRSNLFLYIMILSFHSAKIQTSFWSLHFFPLLRLKKEAAIPLH